MTKDYTYQWSSEIVEDLPENVVGSKCKKRREFHIRTHSMLRKEKWSEIENIEETFDDEECHWDFVMFPFLSMHWYSDGSLPKDFPREDLETIETIKSNPRKIFSLMNQVQQNPRQSFDQYHFQDVVDRFLLEFDVHPKSCPTYFVPEPIDERIQVNIPNRSSTSRDSPSLQAIVPQSIREDQTEKREMKRMRTTLRWNCSCRVRKGFLFIGTKMLKKILFTFQLNKVNPKINLKFRHT